MAVYDDPANGLLRSADGNGAPGAEAETDAAAVASVADSDSCGSDAEESSRTGGGHPSTRSVPAFPNSMFGPCCVRTER